MNRRLIPHRLADNRHEPKEDEPDALAFTFVSTGTKHVNASGELPVRAPQYTVIVRPGGEGITFDWGSHPQDESAVVFATFQSWRY